jgi:hypothetical protein
MTVPPALLTTVGSDAVGPVGPAVAGGDVGAVEGGGLAVPGSDGAVAAASARPTSSWVIVSVEPPKIPEPSAETAASVTPAANAAVTSHPDTAKPRGNRREPSLTRRACRTGP